MITVQYAKAFPHMRINAADPRFTKTDLNSNTGTQTVERGAEISCAWRRSALMDPLGATSTSTAPCPGDPHRAAAGAGTAQALPCSRSSTVIPLFFSPNM
jgi:hypothetical protein